MYRIEEKIALWLWLCVGMVIVMIGIGGFTRLTGSGLSIVDWKPITGIIPPLSHEAWEALFAQYKQFPEFIKVNSAMPLEEFKFIYMVEFIHRFWGRAMGFVLLIPTYYAAVHLRSIFPRALWIWVLAGSQGFMGWYMVKSGLVDHPQVSPIRLTLHLLLAMAILSLLLRTIYDLKVVQEDRDSTAKGFILLASLLVATIFYGGLTAGTHAGWIYNTFPLMNGNILPEDMFALTPWLKNFLYNPSTIQWIHRVLAFLTLGTGYYVWLSNHNNSLKNISRLIAVAITLQVFLGVCTLIMQVPIWLGVVHQVWASISFALAFWGVLGCRKGRVIQAVAYAKI